ncbi:MAG: serine/threonine-protein kinase [Polyangiaceae bacterium]|jgi:serine/threonine-protein kinase
MQSSALDSTIVPELGKYHLVAELARGGMGIVHLAAAQGPGGFNKLLVVKELKPDLSHDESYVSMFLDEARLAARLTHPNIVQTIEVGSEGSRHYMVMEFLDGRSLYRMIRRFRDQGGFPVAAHLRVLAEALVGLHYAHELGDFDGQALGIVHRDVSPLNVFVTFDGQAKVVDFGIAKSIDSSTETKTGVLKGRVAYMAPEQAWGGAVDRRADVYSAGVMLWEAAAGRRLWPGMNDVEILARLLREGPPRLSAVRPDAPEDLDAICARAMELRREDRYASALDMLEDLEAHIASREDRMGMRDVGALVGRVFAEERRRMSALIEETLTRVRGGPRSGVMPTLEVHVRGTPSGASGLREEASQISGQLVVSPLFNNPPSTTLGPAASTPTPSQAVVPGDAPPWWASRRAALVASGGALLLLVVVIVVLTGFRDSAPLPAPDVPVAAAAPAPPARDTTDLVDVVVRVSPPSAQITIDGVAEPTNPFHARYGKDAQVHRVLASADGYDAKLEEVFFANDVSIDVSLDRRAAPPAQRYYPPPPPPAHGGKHAGSSASGPAPASGDASSAPAAPPPRVDVPPSGGHAPLRPIVTSNPYGTP